MERSLIAFYSMQYRMGTCALRWLDPLVVSPENNMEALQEVCVNSLTAWSPFFVDTTYTRLSLVYYRYYLLKILYVLWNRLFKVYTFIKHTKLHTHIREIISDSRITINTGSLHGNCILTGEIISIERT